LYISRGTFFNQIENSSRGEFYGIFKNEFNLDKYLLKLLPHERSMISKLRCNNIKLPIETGRWQNWNKFTSKPLYISRGTFK
jgi:hypothetical protein